MQRILCLVVYLGLVLGSIGPGVAQTKYPLFRETVPVVSVNRENLIQKSQLGLDLMTALANRQKMLVAENTKLAERLEREERELTDLRKTMGAEEFAPLAEAFDNKVKNVRREQDEKGVSLANDLERARFRFFRHAEAVIVDMMRESDILFVLDENVVWLSQGGNITQAVIERMDAAYAAGELSLE